MEPNPKSSLDNPNSHPPKFGTKEDLHPIMAPIFTSNPPPPPPPPTEKRSRRRAREVSSRYMLMASSPTPSSSSYGDPHLASSPRVGCPPSFPHPFLPPPKKHHHPRLKQQGRTPSIPSSPDATDSESESSSCFADENQPMGSVRRSSETPLLPGFQSKDTTGTQRRRAVVRLFDDNGGQRPQAPEHPKPTNVKRRLRPGTPMAYLQRSTRPPTPARVGPLPPAKESGNGQDETFSESSSTVADFSDSETCSVSSQGGLCDSPPTFTVFHIHICINRLL